MAEAVVTASENGKMWMRLGAGLLCVVGMWWYTNPIGLHRQVQVAGITVKVPFGWVAQATPSRADFLDSSILRRAYIPFRPWESASVSRGIWGGPFTMELARRVQQNKFAFESGDSAQYSNARTFELSAGKYRALCAEGTMRGIAGNTSAQDLWCFVVGTPLQASFRSPKDVDGDAARILASLE